MFSDFLRGSGVALDTTDVRTLARAAAAVGVTKAAGLAPTPKEIAHVMSHREVPEYTLLSWRPGRETKTRVGRRGTPAMTATELAAAWSHSSGESCRLVIDMEQMPNEESIKGLLRYAVPNGSTVLVDRTSGPAGHWGWPITIGVLPDKKGMELASRLTNQRMIRRGLGRVVVLGMDGDDCDLLLLPTDLANAKKIKGLPVTPPDKAIGAAVVLGGSGGTRGSIQAMRQLRGTLSAEAVAMIRVNPGDEDRWAEQMLRELSHDRYFDVAMRMAGQHITKRDVSHSWIGEHPRLPLLVTGPELLNYARITPQISGLAERLRSLPETTTINLPKRIREELDIPIAGPETGAAVRVLDVAKRLEEQPLDFVRERDGATVTAIIKERAKEAETPSEERFSDVSLNELDSSNEVVRQLNDDEHLVAGGDYALAFAFRRKRRGIGANDPREAIKTVDETAPKLLVTITPRPNPAGDVLTVAEPTQYLSLPASGDSPEARFKLTTSAGTECRCTLDIRVFDRLNLIEHLVVSFGVGPPGADLGSAHLEQPTKYRELDVRHEPRSAHILVSQQSNTYRITVTIERFDGPDVTAEAFTQFVSATMLESILRTVRDFWIRCALDDFGKNLDATKDLGDKLLRELAEMGHTLWRLLFHTGPSDGGALEAVGQFLRDNAPPEGAVVQVTLERDAQNFIFPWALLYPSDPTTPDAHAFWGIRYAIEQQVKPQALRRADQNDEQRLPFGLRFALYGNFEQSEGQRTLINELAELAGKSLDVGSPIENPTELLTLLKDCSAGLLYIFSHGYTPFAFPTWLDAFRRGLDKRSSDPAAAMMLQVLQRGDFAEDDAWIELTQGKLKYTKAIMSDFRLSKEAIVFLNMCQSAQVMPGLMQSFVWLFLNRAQVHAVLGTECPVNPAFAHQMGKELLPRLLKGDPVGKALREVRQVLIEERGNPLGLAYTLWGSASAQIQPPVLPTAAPTGAANT